MAHPLELIQDRLTRLDVIPIVEASKQTGKTLRVAGLRQSWRRQRHGKTKQSNAGAVYHTVLDDLSGGIRIMLNETVYNSHREILNRHDPLIVEGMVHLDRQNEEPILVVYRLLMENTGH